MVVEDGRTKMSYPKSVFFIVSNEFCERFSFYGMKAVLSLYFTNVLLYSEDKATVFYHSFIMFAYFFPLIGAIISDSWLGKYRTILYLSIVYAIGQLMLSAASVPAFPLPISFATFLGLLLIAMGTGGIKPCVSSFGGDQFKLPQQEAYLSAFFSLFYFAINAGSLLSTVITPILREDVTCYGQETCFPLAFFVPAVLMIVSVAIFFCGRRLYKIKKPEGNIILKVTKCISHALSRKMKSKDSRDHWLDHADDEYDEHLIEDIKSVLKVFKLFIPLPFFWALFDQQGSRWTFQAVNMDGNVFGYNIKPDQFQVVNPLFILLFIPLFKIAIYPVIEKFLFINTPLRKLSVGGLLTALSFVISAFVELNIESTYVTQPTNGLAQLRIFNTLSCNFPTFIDGQKVDLHAAAMYQNLSIPVGDDGAVLSYTADLRNCSYTLADGSLYLESGKSISYAVTASGVVRTEDTITKSKTGYPTIRTALYLQDYNKETAKLKLSSGKDTHDFDVTRKFEFGKFQEVKRNTYSVYLDDKKLLDNVELKSGGVYTILGTVKFSGDAQSLVRLEQVAPPNEVHMLWLLPQYIVITMGEIMFSITGLEFAFTQAPSSMKALLTSAWLLTVAFGNLIVVIISEAHFFDRQLYEFLLFAGLMFIDILIFAVMAMFYKYVEVSSSTDNSTSDDVNLKARKGMHNDSYSEEY